MQHTASHLGRLNSRTPIEFLTGDIPDIADLLDFVFYYQCWYKENDCLGETHIGKWLDVSHRIGPLMSYWILTTQGKVISQTTMQRVTHLETQTAENKERFRLFDLSIHELFKDEIIVTEGAKANPASWPEIIGDDPDFQEEFQRIISDKDLPEADNSFTPDSYEGNFKMELAFDCGDDGPYFAKVTKRLMDTQGLPIGTANDKPILDYCMYKVEYLDGFTTSMAANSITENMFAQVDEERNCHFLFDEIVEHRCNRNQVKMQDAFSTNTQGVKRRRPTKKGWEILGKWKDGSTTWIALKDMKEKEPVQLAEYAVQNRISFERSFAWWAPYVLKKRNNILAKIKYKYWICTHKYGIEIPKNVKRAKEIDQFNHNTLWWDAIMRDMRNV